MSHPEYPKKNFTSFFFNLPFLISPIAIGLIKNGKLKKNDVKFFLGYSGWDKNQLKAEIEDGSWHILKKINDKDVLEDKSNLWKLKLEELGEYFKIWSNSPENPNLN